MAGLRALIVTMAFVGVLSPSVSANDCVPLIEVVPNPASAFVGQGARVWIRLAPGATHTLRNRSKFLRPDRVRRAIQIRESKSGRRLAFRLKVEFDDKGQTDTVVSLKPRRPLKVGKRYRVTVRPGSNLLARVEFEVAQKKGQGGNFAAGTFSIDHQKKAFSAKTLRLRWEAPQTAKLAPIYRVHLAPYGKARPKRPQTVEVIRREGDKWVLDIVARDRCKQSPTIPLTRDLQVWLRPVGWSGTLYPTLGPFRLPAKDLKSPK